MSGLLFAVGGRDITPPELGPLSGFAVRDGRARGVLDPLTVRALLLRGGERGDGQEVALVSFDLIGVPDELPALLAARLPVGLQLVLCATHTHAGPPVLSRAMLGDVQTAYLSLLADRTSAMLLELRARLEPACLRHTKVRVDGIAHNRRVPDGPLDPHADVVEVWTDGEERAALWVNFACHPVVLGPDNLLYSADFPGVARDSLEVRVGVPVVYTTGCAGQINTGHSAMDSLTLTGLERRTPQEARRVGGLLAATVASSLGDAPPAPGGPQLAYRERVLSALTADVPADERGRIEARARRVLSDTSNGAGERAMAGIDLAWLALEPGPTPPAITLTVSLLACAGLRAVFLPGEVFVETALAIGASRPGTLVVAYAHTNPGYIPYACALSEGGYEVDVAYRPYGLPGPFAPDTAARLEEAALSLLSNAP